MFYAKSTGGFYDTAIHGDNIPADAVEITVEEHAALLAGQSSGKRIVAEANGGPVLQDPPPLTHAEIVAAKWDAIKAERDRRKAGGVKVKVRHDQQMVSFRRRKPHPANGPCYDGRQHSGRVAMEDHGRHLCGNGPNRRRQCLRRRGRQRPSNFWRR